MPGAQAAPIPWAQFADLLSGANARAAFQSRCAHLRRVARLAAEGGPRAPHDTDDNLIRRMSSMASRLAGPGLQLGPGDAAVLVPLVQRKRDRQPWALFTHRSFKLRGHRGEICFPGGRIDPGETPQQTALREAHEEIGLEPDQVQVWGDLPAMITRQAFKVQPVLGIIDEKVLHHMEPKTDEVQTVFAAPLAELATCRAYTAFRVADRLLFRMPIYTTDLYEVVGRRADAVELAEHHWRIWGLSAGILSEALAALAPPDLLGQPEDTDQQHFVQ